MFNLRKIVGYCNLEYPTLDPTTSFYEFNSYIECCNSLGVNPSVTKFIRYNQYYKNHKHTIL